MKGIILVAGNGTRLAPTTLAISKPLLPVYDKPMIYYPLTTLLDAGIRDILIITNERDNKKFVELFGDGKDLGVKISYKIQYEQKGIADAFIVGKDFIQDDNVCLILGDNLYCGQSLKDQLKTSRCLVSGAEIYGYAVEDPTRFGVAVFDENKNVVAVEEKPQQPKSNMAVTGLYFFDNDVVKIASQIKPSLRGELEITDVINEYIKRGQCKLNIMDSDVRWMDVGTFDSLLLASNYIKSQQTITKKYIGCVEESAYNNRFINAGQLLHLVDKQKKSQYGQYLKALAEKEILKEEVMDHYKKEEPKLTVPTRLI